MELYKTRTGKIVSTILAVALVFTFSSIAYGAAQGQVEDQAAVQSETELTADLPETGDTEEGADLSGENSFFTNEDEASTDPETPADGTDLDDATMPEGDPEEEDSEPEAVDPEYAYLEFEGLKDAHLNVEFPVPADIPQELNGAPLGEDEVLLPVDQDYTFTVAVESGYTVNPAEVTATVVAETEDENEIPAQDVAEVTIDPVELEEAEDVEGVASFETFTIPASLMRGNVVAELSTNIRTVAYKWEHMKDALETGESIKLGADIEAPADAAAIEIGAPVEEAENVELDLNGYTIKNANGYSGSFFNVPANGAFVISDSSVIEGDNKIKANGPNTVGDFKAGDERKSSGFSEDGILTYYTVSSEPETAADGYKTTADKLMESTISYKIGKFAVPSDEDIKALEEKDTQEPKADSMGALIGSQMNSLVTVANGATLTVKNVFLRNQGATDNGFAINSNGGTVQLDNAHLIGSNAQGENLSGTVYANGGSVTLSDGAVIAANEATGNGGGIWTSDANVRLADGVVAANKALSKSTTNLTSNIQNLPSAGLGGGIYAERGSTLFVQGTSLVASNDSQYLGGGIFGRNGATKIYLTLIPTAQPSITYNKTEFTPNDNQQATLAAMGGGGVCTLGALVMEGCTVTGNYAGDGGGGVMIPTVSGSIIMTNSTVAANYAQASEGGGLYCRTGAGSEIKSGYICNNKCDTEYDEGGGGIFVSNAGQTDRGKLQVWNPIVTGNTAKGYGGGVAGCKNGFTISNNAAIFGNTAEEAQNTTNKIELGDKWAKKVNENASELKGSTKDYFSAGTSTIYNRMLGEGEYNWTGYTSGDLAAANIKGTSEFKCFSNSNKDNQVLFKAKNESNATAIASGGSFYSILALNAGGNKFANEFNADDEFRLTIKNDLNLVKSVIDNVDQTLAKVQRTDKNSFTKTGFIQVAPAGLYGTKKVEDHDGYRYAVEVDGATYYHIYFTIVTVSSTGGNMIDGEGKPTYDGMIHKTYLTASGNGTTAHHYAIFQVKDFPQDIKDANGAYSGNPVASLVVAADPNDATDKGIMGLTANPTPEAIQNAYNYNPGGSLYITDNYCKVNGGGIAINGDVVVGEKPGETPGTDPTSNEGSLTLTKTINAEDYDPTSGDITVTFNVTGYDSSADVGKKAPSYEEVVTLVFTQEDFAKESSVTKTREFKGLKKNQFFIIEEATGNGNFDFAGLSGGPNNVKVEGAKAEVLIFDNDAVGIQKDHNLTVSFTNKYVDRDTYSYAAVNRYAASVGEGVNWSWTEAPEDNGSANAGQE